MQGESNSKTGRRSLTGLDTAEPQLSFYKGNEKNPVLPNKNDKLNKEKE